MCSKNGGAGEAIHRWAHALWAPPQLLSFFGQRSPCRPPAPNRDASAFACSPQYPQGLAQIAALQHLQRSRENRMRVFLSLFIDACGSASAAAHAHQKPAHAIPVGHEPQHGPCAGRASEISIGLQCMQHTQPVVSLCYACWSRMDGAK